MIREQAQYFMPYRRTKIMNEGWATYWHEKIMQRLFAEKFLDAGGPRLLQPLQRAGEGAQPALHQSVPAGERHVRGHRGALEQGALRPGVRGEPRMRGRRKRLGYAPRPGARRRSSTCGGPTWTGSSSTSSSPGSWSEKPQAVHLRGGRRDDVYETVVEETDWAQGEAAAGAEHDELGRSRASS